MGRLIDADDCVLALVDVQEGFLARVAPEAKAGLIARIAFLTLSARFCRIPVVATVESPQDWGGLHPGLVEAVGDAPVLTRPCSAWPAIRWPARRCARPAAARPCWPASRPTSASLSRRWACSTKDCRWWSSRTPLPHPAARTRRASSGCAGPAWPECSP